jgi:hypothetical protein
MTVRQFRLSTSGNSAVLKSTDSSTWAAARTGAGTKYANIVWGTQFAGPAWVVYNSFSGGSVFHRFALTFDTTDLPSDAVISRAAIKSIIKVIATPTDYNDFFLGGYLVQGNHHVPVVDGDYQDMLSQTTCSDRIAQQCDSIGDPINITATPIDVIELGGVSISWIVKNGITKFGVRSEADINDYTPASDCYPSYGIHHVQYDAIGGNSSTDPATDITATRATLSGEVGGLNWTVLEVEYTSATEDVTTVHPSYQIVCFDGGSYLFNSPLLTDLSTIYAHIIYNGPGIPISAIATGMYPNTYYTFRVTTSAGSGAYQNFTTLNASVYPTRPLTRVSAIKHIFQAGEEGRPGIYRMQLILGGLSAGWFPTFTGVQPTAPPPDSAVSGDWTTLNLSKSMDGQQLLAQYGRWLSERTPAQIKAIFGHPPTFDEWRQWYVVYGTGAF